MLSVERFIEDHFLPYVDEQKRASTAKGYKDIWNFHVKGKFITARLRDFRTVDGERFLQSLAKEHNYDLSRTTLKHIKSFLSGVFTFKDDGVFSAAQIQYKEYQFRMAANLSPLTHIRSKRSRRCWPY